MNRTFSSVVVAMLASGCIIVGNGNNLAPGDINVLWSFNGQSCALVPQVSSVRVSIPGAVLENSGVFACINRTVDGSPVSGIRLRDFRGGQYAVTVEGLDNLGRVIFTGTQTVTVNGTVTVTVNTTPTGQASGQAFVSWVFPNNLGCAQVGDPQRPVTRVLVSIDNQPATTFPCAQGNPASGNPGAAITIANLSAGTHQIDLIAQDDAGFTYLRAINTLNLNMGGGAANQFQLQWVVGSLPLRWTIVNNGLTQTCQQAGVPQVFINMRNQATGRYTYADAQGNATAGVAVPCVNATSGQQGIVFTFFEAGNHELYIQAPVPNTNGAYVSNRTGQAPVVQVQAGVFAQSEVNGQQIVLQ